MIKKYIDSPKIITLIKYLYYSFSLMLMYLNNYRDILSIDNSRRLKKLFLYFRYGLYKFYNILKFMVYAIFIILIHIISILLKKIYNIKNTRITKIIYRKIDDVKRYAKYIFRRFKSKEFLLKYTIERINVNIQKRIIKNQQRLQKDKIDNKTKNKNIEIEVKVEIDLDLNINVLHKVKHLFVNAIKSLIHVSEIIIIKPVKKCIAVLFIGNKLKTKSLFNEKVDFVSEKFDGNSKLDIKHCISAVFDKIINGKDYNSFDRIKSRDVFEICNNMNKSRENNPKINFGYQLNSNYKSDITQSDKYGNRNINIMLTNDSNFKNKDSAMCACNNKYINAKYLYVSDLDDVSKFMDEYNYLYKNTSCVQYESVCI